MDDWDDIFEGAPDDEPSPEHFPRPEEFFAASKKKAEYDHLKTRERYLRWAAGEIKYWDEEKQHAYEQSKNSAKPFNEKQDEILVGVHTPADGQTDMQLLQVRDSIRFMAWENEKAWREHVAPHAQNPGGYAYKTAYREHRTATVEKFVSSAFKEPAILWPDAISQGLGFMKSLEGQPMEKNPTFGNLTSFGATIVSYLAYTEVLFNFGTGVQMGLAVWVCSMAAMCYSDEKSIDVLLHGEHSVAKTFVQRAIMSILSPGIASFVTYMTAKSVTGMLDRNQVITFIDEAYGALIGQGDSAEAGVNILKSAMTNPIVKAQTMAQVDGVRKMIQVLSSRIGAMILATNNELPPPDNPMMARYLTITAHSVDSNHHEAVEHKLSQLESPLDGYKAKMRDSLKADSFYVAFVEAAIGAGAISQVDMSNWTINEQMFEQTMNESKRYVNNPKSLKTMEMAARTLCIIDACSIVFTSAITREWRFDPVTKLPLPFEKIATRALIEIELYLCVTMEHCIFAITLAAGAWRSGDSTTIIAAARAVATDFKVELDGCDAQPRLFQNEDPNENAFLDTLQDRVNSGVDQVAVRTKHSTPLSYKEIEKASLTSGFSDRNQLAASEAKIELAFRDVARPLFSVTKEHGFVQVNPMYMEITPSGETTIGAMASHLKSSQKGLRMPAAQIKSVLMEMRNQTVKSPIYTYDVYANSVQLSRKHAGQTIDLPMFKMVSDTKNGKESNRFFILTHCLICDVSPQTIFDDAIKQMNRSFTRGPRFALSCLPVIQRRYSSNSGPEEPIYGTLQVFCIGPNPDRGFVFNRYNAVNQSTVSVIANNFAITPESVLDFERENADATTPTLEIKEDPDYTAPRRRAIACGIDADRADQYSSLHISELLRQDMVRRNAIPLMYPEKQIEENQQKRKKMDFSIVRNRKRSRDEAPSPELQGELDMLD